MPSIKVKGELFSWQHFTRPSAQDLETIADDFNLSESEFSLLTKGGDLPRLYDRGPWNLITFHLPNVSGGKSALEKTSFIVLYDTRRIVTISDRAMPIFGPLMPKGKKKAPKFFDHGTSTDIVVWLLGALFESLNDVVENMLRDIGRLERRLQRRQSGDMTRDIGSLRRDIVMYDLMIDPARNVLEELMLTAEPHRSEVSDRQLRALRDKLRGIHVTLEHYSELVEGIFRMHETLVSHHTNRIVQMLTVISVLLMPPTLVASYYGMNISNLPLSHDYRLVSAAIVLAILLFSIVVYRIRR